MKSTAAASSTCLKDDQDCCNEEASVLTMSHNHDVPITTNSTSDGGEYDGGEYDGDCDFDEPATTTATTAANSITTAEVHEEEEYGYDKVRTASKDDVGISSLSTISNNEHLNTIEVSISVVPSLVAGDGSNNNNEKLTETERQRTTPSTSSTTAHFQEYFNGNISKSFSLIDLDVPKAAAAAAAVDFDDAQQHNNDHQLQQEHPTLSLQDVASLLRQTLKEVEDRIIKDESTECFDLANQQSSRHIHSQHQVAAPVAPLPRSLPHDNNINNVGQWRYLQPPKRKVLPKKSGSNSSSKKAACSMISSSNNTTQQTNNNKTNSDSDDEQRRRHHHHSDIRKLYESSSVCHRTMMKCLGGSPRKIRPPPPFTWTETGWTFLGVFITLLLVFGFNTIWESVVQPQAQQQGWRDVGDDEITQGNSSSNDKSAMMTGVVLGPFGALLTLQYGVTSAPLGQPRNILYGQMSSLLIAFVIGSIDVLPVWFRQTLATVLAISFMVRFGITHPPAGAAALLVSGEDMTYSSMIATLLANIVAIGSATILNNLSAERQYPMSWKLDWPEFHDCLTVIIHKLYGWCYNVCCCIYCKGRNIDFEEDDFNDDQEWSNVVLTEPNTPASTDAGADRTLLTSSSSLLSMSSSSRRTQRYSYSALQWQSLRRTNSGILKSWLSFRSSSSLGPSGESCQSLLQMDDTQNTTTATTYEDGGFNTSTGDCIDDNIDDDDADDGGGGGGYGSIGLPI
jgi:HPP family